MNVHQNFIHGKKKSEMHVENWNKNYQTRWDTEDKLRVFLTLPRENGKNSIEKKLLFFCEKFT